MQLTNIQRLLVLSMAVSLTLITAVIIAKGHWDVASFFIYGQGILYGINIGAKTKC